MHVIIVGSGASGLSVAAPLVKAGAKVTIYEKDRYVGGLAASFTKNNYIFDFGPHIFFGKQVIPELNQFFNAQMVIHENRNLKQAIHIQNKLFNYPFQFKEILKNIEKSRLPKVILEAALGNLAGNNGQQLLEGWVKGRIGNALYDYIELDTYVRKLYGIPASEISSDWGKHRLKPIANLNVWRVLNVAINPWAKKKKRYTYYCLKGIGEIVNHLADYITENGGEILLNSCVERMMIRDGKIKALLINQNGKLRKVSGDIIVFSGKISDLVRMIEPMADSKVLDAANAIRFRDLIILYLLVDKRKLFDHCLVYFSTQDTLFKRITEFKHFSPKMVPENMTSLAVEICINPGDDIWGYEDRSVFEMVMKGIEKAGITKRKNILEYIVVRIPSVYPVYFLNYQEYLRVLFDHIMSISNLISIGRHGLYQHDNMPTAIQSGLKVGRLMTSQGIKGFEKINRAIYNERLFKYQNIS